MILTTFNDLMGDKYNTLEALRMYDDYISTFNELMVR